MYHSLYTVRSHVYTTLNLGHRKFVVKYISSGYILPQSSDDRGRG